VIFSLFFTLSAYRYNRHIFKCKEFDTEIMVVFPGFIYIDIKFLGKRIRNLIQTNYIPPTVCRKKGILKKGGDCDIFERDSSSPEVGPANPPGQLALFLLRIYKQWKSNGLTAVNIFVTLFPEV
jgi:hypothetical protein